MRLEEAARMHESRVVDDGDPCGSNPAEDRRGNIGVKRAWRLKRRTCILPSFQLVYLLLLILLLENYVTSNPYNDRTSPVRPKLDI